MIKLFLLSILCHIIDDFVLQPICLSKLKQKFWWIKECNSNNISISKYRNDYKMALLIHSMSWSIAILLPYIFFISIHSIIIFSLFLTNTIVHFIVDDNKANKFKLNLIEDQIIHLIQIILTFIIVILFA